MVPVVVRAVGTAPIERIELRNGMKVVKVFRPYTREQLGRRIKLLWEGARYRGRGRMATWDGRARVRGNRILGFQPINFDNPLRTCEQVGANELRWQSVTTGGWAGVILELAHANRGVLEVRTTRKNMTVPVKALGLRGRSAKAGGLGLKLQAYRLADTNTAREMVLSPYRPRARFAGARRPGGNPFYVHVVQEDGHRAWSSPIYVVSAQRGVEGDGNL